MWLAGSDVVPSSSSSSTGVSACAGGGEASCHSTAALEHGIVLILHAALQAGRAGLLFVMGLPSLAHEALSAEHPSLQVASARMSGVHTTQLSGIWEIKNLALPWRRCQLSTPHRPGGFQPHVWGLGETFLALPTRRCQASTHSPVSCTRLRHGQQSEADALGPASAAASAKHTCQKVCSHYMSWSGVIEEGAGC